MWDETPQAQAAYIERAYRETALGHAVRIYGADHPPNAVVEAAEQFYEFLSGDYEVQS